MTRLCVFTDAGQIVIILERFKTTLFPKKTVNAMTYECVASLPADRMKCADVIVDAVSTALNIPVVWGRE